MGSGAKYWDDLAVTWIGDEVRTEDEICLAGVHDVSIRIQDTNSQPALASAIKTYIPFRIESVTQRWAWPTPLPLHDVHLWDPEYPDIFEGVVRLPIAWGCFTAKARFVRVDTIEGKQVQVLSDYSNEVVRGECLDPAPEQIPIATPEPGLLLGVVPCLAALALLHNRRRRS
jgi:hypothetical protein